ncbi:Nuclear pore complex protein NUP107 [Vitis vinifera]|uniref:Nuclear pore complex protein n=1 Tax=Vitis vinifera TaxID=29760 RepID=A0A438K7H0_VITVI|nr:Nuclear pore complex protein NUP107 [Vitis vinifera]
MLPICMNWESACWAMAKSWLDIQVDLELARLRPGGTDQFKNYGDIVDGSPGEGDSESQSSVGPENWPFQVLNQQPRQLSALLQKLHSGDTVHEAVTRGCKEQHRQIEARFSLRKRMNLMVGDIPHLVDLLWSWISPSEDDQNVFRPHGDPQMIRFGAHLVLVLRYLLADQMKDSFKEKIMAIGDLIVHMYAMFLFSKQHEELVGIYASQLARHRCIDLFVHMMELRLNASLHVKHKIFLSAIEYLPFSPGDDSKGTFEEIMDSVLSRSREIKLGKYDKSSDVAEQHRLQSLQKAMAIQWLCFTPPSTITDAKAVSVKLLLRALIHSCQVILRDANVINIDNQTNGTNRGIVNKDGMIKSELLKAKLSHSGAELIEPSMSNILFREFSLISMWRVPAMPVGAHTLLSFLAEPLKQPPETLHAFEEYNVAENLKEFQDWSEYYSCDATYRNWLKIESEIAEVPPLELSLEERQRAIAAAKETLNSSLSLLLRKMMSLGKENPWLVSDENNIYESMEPVFLELHATAMLCLPSGECMCPDATLCTTLISALYSSVSEEIVLNRQLMILVGPTNEKSVSVPGWMYGQPFFMGLNVTWTADGIENQWWKDGGFRRKVQPFVESLDHLFLNSPLSLELWNKLFRLTRLDWISSRKIFNMMTISFRGLGNSLRGKVLWQIAALDFGIVGRIFHPSFVLLIPVNVSISPRDNYCIEFVVRCLAVEGDGLGSHELCDGGVLGTVMAAGFKGELARFQAGVTIEISRLDAWYSSNDGSLKGPATYIVQGLCRRCCLPELALRCMQVSVSLVQSGDPPENHDELIELVACPETGFVHLFSQHQLQRVPEVCNHDDLSHLDSFPAPHTFLPHKSHIGASTI